MALNGADQTIIDTAQSAVSDPTFLQNLGGFFTETVPQFCTQTVPEFVNAWGPWAFWNGIGFGKAIAWDYTLQPAGNFVFENALPVGIAVSAGVVGVGLFKAHQKGYDLNPLHLPANARAWNEARNKIKAATVSTTGTGEKSTSGKDDSIATRVKARHEGSGSESEERGRKKDDDDDNSNDDVNKERSRSRSPSK